jgi:hypothetical protein
MDVRYWYTVRIRLMRAIVRFPGQRRAKVDIRWRKIGVYLRTRIALEMKKKRISIQHSQQ